MFLMVALGSKAQFTEETKYVAASFSNFGLSYSQKSNLQIGLNLEGGYFIDDNIMLRGIFGFNHYAKNSDKFTVGATARYYFIENGISIGTGLEYTHLSPNINDLRIPLEVGYTYYLNRYLAVEPTLYYKVSINDFANGSELGLRIGLGYYF